MSQTWNGHILAKIKDLTFTAEEYAYLMEGEYLSRIFRPFTNPKELIGFIVEVDDLVEWLEDDIDELDDEMEIELAKSILAKVEAFEEKEVFFNIP